LSLLIVSAHPDFSDSRNHRQSPPRWGLGPAYSPGEARPLVRRRPYAQSGAEFRHPVAPARLSNHGSTRFGVGRLATGSHVACGRARREARVLPASDVRE